MPIDHVHALPPGTRFEEYRLDAVLGAGARRIEAVRQAEQAASAQGHLYCRRDYIFVAPYTRMTPNRMTTTYKATISVIVS